MTPPVEQPPLKQPPAERPERTAALPVSGPGRGPARTTGGGGSSRSVPWLVPVAVLVALVAVIGAALAARTGGKDEGSGTAVTTTTKTVAVRSDVPWNDTGVDVEAGQSLRVVAYGTVETLKGEPARNSDPAGKPGEEQYGNNVVQGVGHGALIGRIGDGPPFAVGALYEKAAPGTGRLYLGVNDKGLENNHGQYTAELTVR